MKLSIIIPCKNEEGNVLELYNKIKDTLGKVKYEMIYIDDGSTDKTLDILNSIYYKDKEHVRIISFSRNFKKEAAMFAGLTHAVGEYTCIVDGDLQQNPNYLLEMIDFLDNNKDYDEVAMRNKSRNNESFIMKFFKKMFYKCIDKMSDVHFENATSDFRMFRENVKMAMLTLKEKNRFTKGIFSWVGFNIKYMDFEMEPRKSGKTSFGFVSSIKYAISGITDFSDKPLKVPFIFGLLLFIIAIIYLIVGIVINSLNLVITLMLILFSVTFVFMGIMGTYISKIHSEVKDRPIYISKLEKGFKKDDEYK
jgi:glycosyltransferase involved in cell wall biosynthesis